MPKCDCTILLHSATYIQFEKGESNSGTWIDTVFKQYVLDGDSVACLLGSIMAKTFPSLYWLSNKYYETGNRTEAYFYKVSCEIDFYVFFMFFCNVRRMTFS